ncbi:MAG: hypothetical protein AABX05_06020, partial [Nanoarchaeota archaeon]
AKNYWRWNWLNLSFILLLLLSIVVFVVVKLIVLGILKLLKMFIPVFAVTHLSLINNITNFVDSMSTFYLLVVFVSIFFLIAHAFSKKYLVWESFNDGFKMFKHHWKKIMVMSLFATLVAVIISVITSPLNLNLMYSSTMVSLLVNLVIVVFFVAWLRLYLLKVIE